MKTTLRESEAGGTLIITVITCALVGTVLASSLGLITSRNRSAMRATAWNTAIPVLEAGIEEALTHLQADGENRTANGWTAETVDGKMVYWKHRTLPDGSYYYVTNFGADSSAPVIRSAGYVRSPLEKDDYISRVVEVGATNPPSLFSKAIAANGLVKLSGGAVVDGYNSAAGPYGGTNRNASGGIATNSKQPKAIDVGTAHLYGTAVTGPGGTVAVNGGAVGDLDWHLTNTGIEPGWTNNNMNVTFQPNAAPGGTPLPPVVTKVGTSNITYLASGDYKQTSFISNDKSRPMIVTGEATLWVPGDFVVSGTGYVYIAPNASLKLYVGGTASISGGGVVNGSGLPANFSYFGLPSSKLLNYSGSASFVGTINAPQADFVISGGSSVFGAVICNTFTSSGGSGVHYDEGTASKGIFLVTAWREL